MTINEILKYSVSKLKEKNIKEYILKAKIIVSFAIDKPKEYLISHDNEELLPEKEKQIKEYIAKIIEGIPIQYITKKQEFMGLEFVVNENVLIPRQDTENLVEEVINICKENNYKYILDLCTGSGAIAISLAKYIENTEITASDISKKAIEIAKKNDNKYQTKIKFIESDLFCNIYKVFDLIVSNPPYIKSEIIKNLDKEVQKEPHLALDGGEDGLDIYRKIINEAYKFLKSNGYLCLEIGYDQKEEVIELIKKTNKYYNIYSKKDLGRK